MFAGGEPGKKQEKLSAKELIHSPVTNSTPTQLLCQFGDPS